MHLGPSQGGATVSKAVGRGFDSFRACDVMFVDRASIDFANRPATVGHQHLDNRRGIDRGQRHLVPHGSFAPWGLVPCQATFGAFRTAG